MATQDRDKKRRPTSGSSLIRNFAIGSLVIFAIVAVALYFLISAEASNDLEDEARGDVGLLSGGITGSGVIREEWMTNGIPPEDLIELAPISSSLNVEGKAWEAVTLFNDGGLVIFSSDVPAIGERFEVTPGMQDALEGEVAQATIDRSESELPNLDKGNKLVTMAPFRLGGEIVGVLEITQSIDAEQAAVQSRLFTQMAIIGGGLLLIYLALIPVVARASKTQRETLERLEELDAAKDDLLAFSAHEFRTPLTSLLGFAQTLSLRRSELSDSQIDDHLDTILRQGKRLQRVADDFLDAAAIEADRLDVDLGPVSAARVAHQIVDEFPDADLAMSTETALVVNADRTRLEQILTNLVRNAFTHGPKGGRVRVAVHTTDADCCFDVVDDGPGIPSEVSEQLFAKFERGDGRSRGSGLGLYIARHLAEAQGGALEVVTDAPTTTFRLRIPLAHHASADPTHGRDDNGNGDGDGDITRTGRDGHGPVSAAARE